MDRASDLVSGARNPSRVSGRNAGPSPARASGTRKPSRASGRLKGFPLAALVILVTLAAACTGPSATGDSAGTPSGGTSEATWAVPCPTPAGAGDIGSRTLPCLGDGGGQATALAGGTPTVITLWASWCAPCRAELPEFESYAAAHTDVAVLGVNTGDLDGAALALAAELGLTFPSRFDPEQTLLTHLGKQALPVTVFVDSEGAAAHVYQGVPLAESDIARLAAEHLGVTE